MLRRLQKLHPSHSFFLFGARGMGKTTLLKEQFQNESTLWIDLLTEADEECFGRNPDELLAALKKKAYSRVVIDEVQKAPKILDLVHKGIETYKQTQFIMTGSSARKLKRGSANLLAGRAFVYQLHPLVFYELLDMFDLIEVLNFGSLPKIFQYNSKKDKVEFLKSYAKVYLREEVQLEQLIRKLNPFRNFLEVAAQANGQIINQSKIASHIGVDDKTVVQYFQILEDTLLGFRLNTHYTSARKRQAPPFKFYFFDLGVKKALERSLNSPLVPQTYAFGQAFEHFLISECHRLNEYFKTDYRFFYFKNKEGVEVDLVIDRGKEKTLLVEIKSSHKVDSRDIKHLKQAAKTWNKPCEMEVWSQDPLEKRIDETDCLPWTLALKQLWPI